MGESESERGALLRAACATGSLKDLKLLLMTGGDISVTDEWGRSLLYTAVENGHVDVVKHLIHLGLDIGAVDKFNESLLHAAVRVGNKDMIHLLVQSGAVRSPSRRSTQLSSIDRAAQDTHGAPEDLLVLAAAHATLDVVKYLVSVGFPVVRTLHSQLLSAAIKRKELEMIRYFSDSGADLFGADQFGNSFLRLAAKYSTVAIVEYFVQKGVREDGDLLLRAAVEGDQLDILRYLVTMRLNLHGTDRAGRTLLHLAVERASPELIEFLVSKKIDTAAVTRDGSSLVHAAVARGDLAMVQYVESLGLQVAHVDQGPPSLLHLAVRSGSVEVVKHLIDEGVSTRAMDENGYNLLEVAMWRDELGIIQLLEQSGLDPRDPSLATRPLLRIAVEHAGLQVIQHFVDNGLSVLESDKGPSYLTIDCDDLDILEDEYVRQTLPECSTDSQSEERFTMLHAAVQRGDLAIVRYLVDLGLDLLAVDRQGRTLMHLAANASVDMAQYLADRGVNATAPDKRRKTALHTAIRRGAVDIAKVLVRNGVDVIETDRAGPKLLPLAVKSGNVEAIAWLVANGLDLASSEKDGRELLEIAVSSGDVAVVEHLRVHGIDPRAHPSLLHLALAQQDMAMLHHLVQLELDLFAVDERQDTLLHVALHQLVAPGTVDIDLLKYLVEKALDVNAPGKRQETPLHVICRVGDVQAASYLLDNGANVSLRDADGLSPLHVASHNWNVPLIRLLLDAGAPRESMNKDGLMPLGMALSSVLPLDNRTLGHLYDTARMLCKAGATWSSDCEDALLQWPQRMQLQLERQWSKTSSPGQESDELEALFTTELLDEYKEIEPEYQRGLTIRLGIRVCVLHWTREYSNGETLSKVPFEVLRRGEQAVTTYLRALKTTGTEELRYRHKVCVTGPTQWGKTSFVRSVVASRSHPAAEGDRTVGIDLGAYAFVEESPASVRCHDVTFWDFAGQDVYRVVHSLFFSKHTLYLLCIDLAAYAAVLQLDDDENNETSATSSREIEARVARFVSTSILSWLRLILSRQPDAEVLIVGTKVDQLKHRTHHLTEIQRDFQLRLHTWKQTLDQSSEQQQQQQYGPASVVKPSSQVEKLLAKDWLIVSSLDDVAVQSARAQLEHHIASSGSCFVMPATYSRVLKAILTRRDAAARLLDGSERIKHLIVPVHALCKSLLREVMSLRDVSECLFILHSLHDVGDILWYESAAAGPLRDIVIVDPLLVVDLVREIVNHEQLLEPAQAEAHDGRVAHSQLMRCHLWKDMDRELVYAFKTLFQFFQVVYASDNSVMDWDADLIVPSYWQARHDGMPEKPLLQQRSSIQRRGVGVSVQLCWEYDLPAEIAATIFEQLAVESYTPLLQRTAWHKCIESFASGVSAARIELWPGQLNTDAVRIEVVADDAATAWRYMRFYVMAMETVLDRYPGLAVSRYLVEMKGTTEKRHRIGELLKSLDDAARLDRDVDSVRTALPVALPDLAWFIGKAWRDPSVLQQLRMQELMQQSVDAVEVVRRLVIAGEKARRYPALWTIEYDPEKEQKMTVKMLSDLSGVCYHAPIDIDVPSILLAKYGEWIQSGVSLCANVVSTVLSIGVITKAIQAASPEIASRIDQAKCVHNLVDQLDLPASGGVYTSSSRKLPPGISVLLLRELLHVRYGDAFDELKVSSYSNLECAATAEGHFVWAHRHELLRLHGAVELYDPGQFVTPAASSSSSTSNATVGPLQLRLSVTRITGLSPWDWRRAYCEWRVFFGESQTPLGTGKTSEHQDASIEPSWPPGSSMPWPFIQNEAMLRKCRLEISINRPSRFLGKTKRIDQGTVWLRDFLPPDDGAMQFQCDVVQVPLGSQGRYVTSHLTSA